MINHSIPEYIFIRACIFGLQAVTPISITWTVLRAIQYVWRPQSLAVPTLAPLDVWFAAETVFYLGVQLPVLARIQRPAQHPPLLPESERQQLFRRFENHAQASDLEQHLCGWFRGARLEDIGRCSVKSWLAWAFFEGRVDLDSAELEEYVTRLEKLLGKGFADGIGNAKPIRLTLDPIHVSHRSLAWYAIIGIVDSWTYMQLCWFGFQHFRRPLASFLTLFPFRPFAQTARHRSPAEYLTYWIRPHTSKTRLPVVFIHGIGIGLYPYTNFLRDLNKNVDLLQATQDDRDDGHIGIIAIELMPVSFRLTHSALSRPAFLEDINKILCYHGYDEFTLVAHSYGSIMATHMLRDPTLSPKISSLLLVDPVCFLLHTPSVAYNFTVRKPRKANEWQLWYFASKDWGVAHTLGRRFFWRENVLWRDEVVDSGKRVTVSLAARDLIVDTNAVGRYVSGADETEGEWKEQEWTGKGLEVLWNEDKDHAQVFESGWMRDRLVGVVREYTKQREND